MMEVKTLLDFSTAKMAQGRWEREEGSRRGIRKKVNVSRFSLVQIRGEKSTLYALTKLRFAKNQRYYGLTKLRFERNQHYTL